jgi:hypothetical protein
MSVEAPRAGRTRLWLLAIPLLSAVFGFVSGHVIDQQIPMAVFGMLWGIGAMFTAPRVARRGADSDRYADAPICVLLPLTFAVLGASVIVHLLGPSPAAFLHLVKQAAYGLFFAGMHTVVEWLLMPWALMANWWRPMRRRLLIVAAGFFYLGRVASALYFAPAALEWVDNPAVAAANLDQIAVWMRLDVLRLVLQDTVIAAMVLAVAFHAQPRPAPV